MQSIFPFTAGSLAWTGREKKDKQSISFFIALHETPSPESASCIINLANILGISFSHFIMGLLKMGEKKVSGADKMMTEPTTKPENLNLIHGTHTMEGKNRFMRVVL